jgi:hypothetical protein
MNEQFFYMENKALNSGAGLILSNRPGFPIAKVFKFETNEMMERFLVKYNLHGAVGTVQGYRIVLAWVGNLTMMRETPVLSGGLDLELLNTMANFYEQEKIHGSESRNKRYAL